MTVPALSTDERRAIAKAVSVLEAGGAEAEALITELSFDRCSAWRVGITGPPGAGKSTLTARLAEEFANQGERVAVVAVDPSSPFTHGAILGDRVRMTQAAANPNIFVRSMASRGASGGLNDSAGDVVDLLDAHGFDVILTESVGVGQQDIDVRSIVDTTLVLLVPESGDHIQTIKAGIMEAGDIYAVNKMDRPRASAMLAAIKGSREHQHRTDDSWNPRVLGISAENGQGCDELLDALRAHREHTAAAPRASSRRRARVEHQLWKTAVSMLETRLATLVDKDTLTAEATHVLVGDNTLSQSARSMVAKLIGTDDA